MFSARWAIRARFRSIHRRLLAARQRERGDEFEGGRTRQAGTLCQIGREEPAEAARQPRIGHGPGRPSDVIDPLAATRPDGVEVKRRGLSRLGECQADDPIVRRDEGDRDARSMAIGRTKPSL